MMTQSVITQTANLFGGSPAHVTSKTKSGQNGFEMLMNSNLKATGGAEKVTPKQTEQKNTGLTNPADKNDYNDVEASDQAPGEAKRNNEIQDVDRTGTKETDNTDKEVTNADTGISEEDITDKEELLGEIQAMLQSIRNAVMEILNLSEEELNQLLTDQGLTTADLMNPDTLKQLVLDTSQNTDQLAFLTDEKLAEKLNGLLHTVENIKNDAGIRLTEEQIKAVLEDAANAAETLPKPELVQTEATANQGKKIQPAERNVTDRKAMTDAETGDSNKPSVEVIKYGRSEETGTDASETSGDEKNPMEPSKQFETFLDNLTQNVRETRVDFSGEAVKITELREIANQIIESIKVVVKPEQSTMELQLNPEHLGKVNLTVQSKNGAMTAQFVVQNEIAKEAIEAQMHTLRETLNEQGVKVEAIEVTVASYTFEQNNRSNKEDQQTDNKKNGGPKISLEEALNMNEIPDQPDLANEIAGMQGSSINITA